MVVDVVDVDGGCVDGVGGVVISGVVVIGYDCVGVVVVCDVGVGCGSIDVDDGDDVGVVVGYVVVVGCVVGGVYIEYDDYGVSGNDVCDVSGIGG